MDKREFFINKLKPHCRARRPCEYKINNMLKNLHKYYHKIHINIHRDRLA